MISRFTSYSILNQEKSKLSQSQLFHIYLIPCKKHFNWGSFHEFNVEIKASMQTLLLCF